MNRRKFLKLIGATLGVSTATCCGLGTLATYQPKIDFVENHHQGGNKMSKRILVAYASKAGSTSEVAAFMGNTLGANGLTVDVCPIEKVTNIQGYQAVVVGSAVRAGKWIPAATKFVETHQAILSQIPTAYFTCCMTLHQDTPENQRKALSFMDPAREILEPVDIGAFAGKMDYGKISFLERFLVTKVFSTPEGDFRNWDAIQTWTTNLQPKLWG
jgi:menaquinone-dependent protoporphyrinogen oxidase